MSRGRWTGGSSGGGSDASWSPIAFALSIAFTGKTKMPRQVISGVLAFTPNLVGAVSGATCYVRLVADGVNAPTFVGFKEWGGSSGWNNTAGILNSVTFFYDGDDAYYSVTQAVGVQPIVPPSIASAAVVASNPSQIVLTISAALASINPAVGAFVITNSGGTDTVTAVAVVGNKVTLTKSRATQASDVITLTYTKPGSNPLQNSAGDLVATTSNLAVINGLAVNNVRLATTAGLTETGDGTAGYNYAGTGANTGFVGTNAGVTALKIPANNDGFFQFTVGAWAGAQGPYLGLKTTSAVGAYTTSVAGVYLNTVYQANTGATGGQANDTPGVTPAIGDIVRMRRAGSTLYAEVSKDSGATFSTIKTWAGSSTADLYALVIMPLTTSRADVLRGLNVS